MDIISPKAIHEIAKKFDFSFKKGLGQNFLTSESIIEEIADAADTDGEGVLEIGPGFGTLTQALARRARKVVSIEIDERLSRVLEYTLAEYGNIKIVCADVMKTDLNKLIRDEFNGDRINIAANLPYYITTPVITMLLESSLPVKNIVVMVQKEVAQRICAAPGGKDYGAITLLCRYYTEPEIITTVPAGLFVPPPKVDSAVLRLSCLDEPRVKVLDEAMFFKTVKAAFSQRRKTLLNCLASAFPYGKPALAAIAESVGIDAKRRGETLSIDEFAKLSDALCNADKFVE